MDLAMKIVTNQPCASTVFFYIIPMSTTTIQPLAQRFARLCPVGDDAHPPCVLTLTVPHRLS
jgi:hypothetical protein